MSRKLITLLLAAIMVAGLFAGCTGGDNPSAAPSATPSAATDAQSPSPSDETGDDINSGGLPIVDEKVTLTDWKEIQTLSAVFLDWNDCTGYQEIEKRTNVHIEFSIPAYGNENESFNLLIASQDYPDIIEFFHHYSRGIDDAIEQDIIIRLNDVIDDYMPNYKKLISDPERELKTKTDTGNIGLLYCIYNEPQNPWAGLCIREDWLNDLGMEKPRTYDEVYEVLTAFKEEKGVKTPMLLNPRGDTAVGYCWGGGFGAINGMMQIDGTVYYGPLRENYRLYLETMHKWYSEGLIDQDFMTSPDFLNDTSYVYRNDAGIWFGYASGDYEYLNGQPEDENFLGTALRGPVMNKGENTHFKVTSADVGIGSAISAQCENVEIAARWLDYCYSDEGSIYLNFGTEGVTFFFDENGEPTMDAEAMEEVFNMPFANCRQATGPVEAPYLRHMYRTTPVKKATFEQPEYFYQAYEILGEDGQDWMIPAHISPTAEEGSEYSALFNDIDTYVTETTVQIIIGSKDISAYDDMVTQIKQMGVDRAIELRQAAVTRYFDRAGS